MLASVYADFMMYGGTGYALPIAAFLTISRRAHRARHVARHRATLMFCRRKNIAKDLEK